MEDINKRICALDKIIEFKIEEKNESVSYNKPNQLQSDILGMTVSPEKTTSKNTTVKQYGLKGLRDVLKDLCKKKGFETNFDVEFNNIEEVLEGEEFKLPEAQSLFASLISDSSDDYPKYNKEKEEEALGLKGKQVLVLAMAFINLTEYLNQNQIDKSCTYRETTQSNYYDDSTTRNYIVEDSYNACLKSIRKAHEVVFGPTLVNEEEMSSSPRKM